MRGLLAEVITQLGQLGYSLAVEGKNLKATYTRSGRPDPVQVKPLLNVLKRHKAEALAYLQAQALFAIPSCTGCPWCLDNPWTHYPKKPKWCGYWWDHLVADSPQCQDRRDGRVPDPKSRTTMDLVQPSQALPPATCSECAHFTPARSSPNPTQAWGRCRHTGQGRYGVARACDAYQCEAWPERGLEEENIYDKAGRKP